MRANTITYKPHQAEKPTTHPFRAWRKHNRVTQQEVADILGNTRAHISQIEHYRIIPGMELTLRLWILSGLPWESWFPPKALGEAKCEVVEHIHNNKGASPALRKRAAKIR